MEARSLDQADKFKQAARGAECDEHEVRSDDRLQKIARQKSIGNGTPNANGP